MTLSGPEHFAAWLSRKFDCYDEPPTLAEIADAHPLYRTEASLEPLILAAMGHGYVESRHSDEGTVYIPGPELR